MRENPLHHVSSDDLMRYGLIPEFVGRLPVVAALDTLDIGELRRVLTDPANSILRQYRRLFEMDGVELVVTDGALSAIAEQAITRQTGARGFAHGNGEDPPTGDVRDPLAPRRAPGGGNRRSGQPRSQAALRYHRDRGRAPNRQDRRLGPPPGKLPVRSPPDRVGCTRFGGQAATLAGHSDPDGRRRKQQRQQD